ncbi:SGNH/GDSL hydrolase family protein [Opitutaceae bacterium TAV4]|nr:SGNH/GDSL hydrolase family protein [Opitutaceae bacterium TAV4]RRK00427.1 SGNH/GDSL hydrolase family protein [Opitutaceae bacterium TAV3]
MRILAFSLALISTMLSAAPVAKPPPHPFVARLEAGAPQKIVFYGTSLTANGAWVPQLSQTLEKRFPGLVSFANGARSGQHSRWGVQNLDASVLAHQPDVVFIEFSVNDAVARFQITVDEARRNLEAMIDRILAANPKTDIILQVMNPVIGRPPGHASHRRELPRYQDVYREVGRERGLLVIDHMPAWTALLESDEKTFRSYVPDGLHPAAQGYSEIVLPEILRRLGLEARPMHSE